MTKKQGFIFLRYACLAAIIILIGGEGCTDLKRDTLVLAETILLATAIIVYAIELSNED